MTAIGTVGTAAVAAVVLLRDQHDRRRTSRLIDRQQASKITAWVSDDVSARETLFEISNMSDLPAFDFVILTADSSIAKIANLAMGALSPKETFSDRRPYLATQDWGSNRRRPVPVAFFDANGRRWLRDGLGLLYECNEEHLSAIEYPNGIVGGAAKARQFYDRRS